MAGPLGLRQAGCLGPRSHSQEFTEILPPLTIMKRQLLHKCHNVGAGTVGEPPPGGWKLRGAWEAGETGETRAKTLWQTILVMELELGSVIDGEVLSEQGARPDFHY